jgi:hypothetical protein
VRLAFTYVLYTHRMSSVAAVRVPKSITIEPWPAGQRAVFRFAFVFLLLSATTDLVSAFPSGRALIKPLDSVWVALVPWIHTHLLHLQPELTVFSKTDTAFAYVQVLTQALLALIAALIWAAADRGRDHYGELHYAVRILVRYSLAYSMLMYGTVKIFQVQFPTPPLTSLVMPLGELTPHRLLWSAIGFTRTYQVFSGAVECVGALLLFSRRTTTLGAVLLVGALTNVLMMNISYGVNVKVIAARLLVFALFLTIPDLGRMWRVLVLNRPTMPSREAMPAWSWRTTAVLRIVGISVAVYLIGSTVIRAYELQKPLKEADRHPPLYGSYVVQRSVRNGQEVGHTSLDRWQFIAFDGVSRSTTTAAVRLGNEVWERYGTVYDTASQIVTMTNVVQPGPKLAFRYSRLAPGQIRLEGKWGVEQVEITLQQLPQQQFPLNRPEGRRWITAW